MRTLALVFAALAAGTSASFLRANASASASSGNVTAPNVPCILYMYSRFHNPDGSVNTAMDAEMIVPGCQTIFDEAPVPGAAYATRMAPESFTYASVSAALQGSDYVSVDEITAGRTCAEDCTTVVNQLAANGLGGRVIFFFNYAPLNPGVQEHAGLAQACAAGACRIGWETYTSSPGIRTSTRGSDATVVAQYVQTANSLGGGVAAASFIMIGIANQCPGGPCYLDDAPNDFAGLDSAFSAVHSQAGMMSGVGLYDLANVVGNSVYSAGTLAVRLRGYLSYW